jgi:hypothetical protein
LEIQGLSDDTEVCSTQFSNRNLQKINCLVIDGYASSEKSIHDIVHPKFPNASIVWYLWHLEKKMEKKYKQLISERTQKRGPLKYPNLVSNLSEDELKRHFSFCAEHYQKDRKLFETHWLGRLDYWKERPQLSTNSTEMVALETFMKSYLDDIPDYLVNKRTYLSESFHSLTTHYCIKGVPFSFETYKVRKYLAVLH